MESEIYEEDIDGVIRSIHVRNFFCHDNLEITFNPNVNFIVGRNGSGKSAILTALVVGLGGRASATNRGSNLSSFVKKGANSATVEIKIKNSSPKAFKHNLYGDFITIIRNINASGGSSYKVKSSSGEIISTKFEEVNSIITAHDIQVDNPISVLNQDDARSFHASDAKKKYSLFRKATNLDQTEANYVRALENCEKAESIWKRKNEACLELEKEFKKWESSYEQLQSRDEIEAQKESLQNEYYWSVIAELEKDANNVQAQYDKQNSKVKKLIDKLNSMENSFDNNSETINTLKTQLSEKSEQKSSLEQELRRLDSEVRELQNTWRKTQHGTSKQRDTLNREMKKIADLETEIANIQSGTSASRQAELESRESKAADDVAKTQARFSSAKHHADQARANLNRVQSAHESVQTELQRHHDKIKHRKQELRELESRGNDSLAVYGNNMVELCQRVQDAVKRGVFSAPPKGPVGAYLKVKERKWGGALEHIIAGGIHSFCVNTPEDSRKLFDIMGKVYGSSNKPSVTCCKFLNRVHNVAKNKVCARGYVCALDAVDVSDAVVANYLIDNVGLEGILLVNEHEDAIRLSDNVENVPVNCAKIVTLDGSEYYPAPNYRSYGGAGRPARFLHLSTAERKKQVLAEITELESAASRLRVEFERCEEELEEARGAERGAAGAVRALMTDLHSKEAALRAATAAREHHHAPQHRVLQEELEVSRKAVQTLQSQLSVVLEDERRHKQKVDEYDVHMKRIKTKLGKINGECRALSDELDQEQLKLDNGVAERQMLSQRLKEDQSKLGQVEVIIKDKQKIIADKTREALALCPRVENPRDKTVVCQELQKTQMKLSSIRSDGLSKAQVADKLVQVERKFRKTKQMLHRLLSLITEIKKTSDKHLNFCHRVQTSIARRVQYCFQSILKLRGYSGSMEIDNGRGVLEISCTGRETAKKRVASSTSSLSGGERSYSTVAFIMALWDCVELPFHFMDEFDVFMDNVNRKIVMELLIDHALKNTSRQFVFLTPQDASSVSSGPQIKIHRMADPRR